MMTRGRTANQQIQASRWWPPLVTAADHAVQRGWRLEDLLGAQPNTFAHIDDACQALVWRILILTDPVPDHDLYEPFPDPPPDDMWHGFDAAAAQPTAHAAWDAAEVNDGHYPQAQAPQVTASAVAHLLETVGRA